MKKSEWLLTFSGAAFLIQLIIALLASAFGIYFVFGTSVFMVAGKWVEALVTFIFAFMLLLAGGWSLIGALAVLKRIWREIEDVYADR